MKPTLVRLIGLPRRTKQLVLMVSDFLFLPVLFWAALELRYDTDQVEILPGVPLGLPLMSALGVSAFIVSGVYRAVVRAFDERFLHELLRGVGILVTVLFLAASLRLLPMPRSVPFIFGFFAFLWVWASRSAIRKLVRLAIQLNVPVKRVAIYGAGTAGRQVLAVLRSAPEYFPVAFFDDGQGLSGTMVHGLRVFSGAHFQSLYRALELDEVLIALPSISRDRRREIIEQLEPLRLRVRTLPGLDQLFNAQFSISDLREVDITDLLGRDPVPPVRRLLEQDIAGKRVLITGAGGSIGAELCRQVVAQGPELLVLFERSEFALYQIDQELMGTDTCVVPVLGSVLHEDRLARVLQEHAIDTVYHAAAYKHVPIVEDNPFEGLINNAIGTYRAAKAALTSGVSTFVLISTDKAVRPTNVMGASKRLAEMVLQALAAEPATSTRYCIVRFGNVLGSSGSVVPLFREQIGHGGPLTVTHPEVTRYFMTISEAAQLVIQAGAMGQGGDVFVLDMGESVKILDLARKMVRLSGLSVREADNDGDIEIVFSGLRPGEKLYEELLIGSNVSATEHERIMRATERYMSLDALEPVLEMLWQLARETDVAELKRVLAEVIDGYMPDVRISAGPPMSVPLALGTLSPNPDVVFRREVRST